jgi:hypothetical protein
MLTADGFMQKKNFFTCNSEVPSKFLILFFLQQFPEVSIHPHVFFAKQVKINYFRNYRPVYAVDIVFRTIKTVSDT